MSLGADAARLAQTLMVSRGVTRIDRNFSMSSSSPFRETWTIVYLVKNESRSKSAETLPTALRYVDEDLKASR